MAITSKPAQLGRRSLQFEALDDVLADVEQLAASDFVTVGNWTFPQIMDHLTMTMNYSFDGFPFKMPWPARFLARHLLKKRFLTKSMPSGFKLKGRSAVLIPAEDGPGLNQALDNFRAVIGRMQNEGPTADHAVLGPMTPTEWEMLHRRHAELHLSFVRPANS